MSEEALRQDMRDLARRMDQIDSMGTRGMSVLAVQVQELAKDLAKHETQHDQERRERVSGRRWIVSSLIGAVAAVDVPTLLVLILHRLGQAKAPRAYARVCVATGN